MVKYRDKAAAHKVAVLRWKDRHPLKQKVIDWKAYLTRRGKTVIFKPTHLAEKLEEKACYFCSKPWKWLDMKRKTKRDVLEEDVIVTCKECHHIYSVFDSAEEMVSWVETMNRRWSGIQ